MKVRGEGRSEDTVGVGLGDANCCCSWSSHLASPVVLPPVGERGVVLGLVTGEGGGVEEFLRSSDNFILPLRELYT
jgi:hypothetical protein